MTALGYTDLDEALTPLLGDFPDAAGVSDAANELSRRLYAYLADHLPPVQAQRKHRSFLTFAAERAHERGEALTPGCLDDELVLDYWTAQAAGGEEGGDVDVRTFRGVFETAARLIRILRFAEEKYRMGGALPIGTDFEAGEVDPADFERALGEIEESDDPAARAEVTLGGAVKFLNKRELGVLAEAARGEAVARALVRSILRDAVFGAAQARLTQAQRGKPGPEEMAALIDELPDADYVARLEDYRALAAHLDRMLLAAFHVLARKGRPEAISLALALRPEMDLDGLAMDPAEPAAEGNVVSFQAAAAGRKFFEELEAGGGDLGQLGTDALAAFKAISRKGFTAADVAAAETTEAFVDGATLLLELRGDLAGFLEKHSAPIDWSDQFTADTPVFKQQFTLLYGGQHG